MGRWCTSLQIESFLNYVTSGLNIYGGTRVGMQLYNEYSNVQFQLNTYNTTDDVSAAIGNLEFTENATSPFTGREVF